MSQMAGDEHQVWCSGAGPLPCHICSPRPAAGLALAYAPDAQLHEQLAQWMAPETMGIWWSSHNRRLGTRPMDAYALTGADGLVEAAAADVMGDYA